MRRCLSCDYLFDGTVWTCPACGWKPERRDGYVWFAPDLIEKADAFDVKSFVDLARLEEQSFWFPRRNNLILWAFRKYFPHARSFFELGCGTGIVLKAIADASPGMEVWGADIYTEGLHHAEDRLGDRATFIQLNGQHLPFRDEFDVVAAFDVVEHIDDDVGALSELYRTIRPGGGAMIMVPRHMFLWSPIDDLAQHKRRYSGSELRRKMKMAGFSEIRQLSFGALTLPLQYLSRRLMQAKSDRLADLLELDLPPYQQTILGMLMDLDQIPVRMGVNYMFGATLLALGRKS